MFREALTYPTRPPAGPRALVVGAVALLVVFAVGSTAALGPPIGYLAVLAVVPWLLVRGYYVRVVRTSAGHARPVPPHFDRPRALLVDGLAAVLVAVAYLLPAAAVLGPLVYLQASDVDIQSALRGAGVPEVAVAAAVSGLGALAIVSMLGLLGALYALPVAVARYAHDGRLAAAFDLEGVVRGANSEDYVVAWLVSLLLQVVVLPVAYALRVVLVGFLLQFLVAVGVRYCYGVGTGRSLALEAYEHRATRPSLEPAVRRVADADRWDRSERRRSAPIPAIRRISDAAGDGEGGGDGDGGGSAGTTRGSEGPTAQDGGGGRARGRHFDAPERRDR